MLNCISNSCPAMKHQDVYDRFNNFYFYTQINQFSCFFVKHTAFFILYTHHIVFYLCLMNNHLLNLCSVLTSMPGLSFVSCVCYLHNTFLGEEFHTYLTNKLNSSLKYLLYLVDKVRFSFQHFSITCWLLLTLKQHIINLTYFFTFNINIPLIKNTNIRYFLQYHMKNYIIYYGV